MHTIQTTFDAASSVSALYDIVLSSYTAEVVTLCSAIRDTYLADVYAELSTAIGTRNDTLARSFAEKTQLTTADYYIYSAFMELATDPMLAVMSGTDPLGTYIGYALTVRNMFPYADDLYEMLQNVSVEVIISDPDCGVSGVAVAGVAGFAILKSNYARFSTAFTIDETAPDAAYKLETVEQFAAAVSALALDLARGNVVIPSMVYGMFAIETHRQSAIPAQCNNDVRRCIMNAFSVSHYATPYIFAFAEFEPYSGVVVSSSLSAPYSRGLENGTDKDTWVVVQSAKRFNFDIPTKSDFRMVQVQHALEANLADSRAFGAFSNALRTYPFRTAFTAFLLTADSLEEKAMLQKCTSIRDSAKVVVSCADPPEPTNWAVVVISLILTLGIVFIWGFGIRFARAYDRGDVAAPPVPIKEKAEEAPLKEEKESSD